MAHGITVKQDTGGSRVEIQCKHQNALIYVVPGEASWVCTEDLVHAHAIAGLFHDLAELDLSDVNRVMRKWGVYYRERPLNEGDGS